MSVNEQQKAYHLRKMRTRMHRMDMNHDGYISREDFELMAKRLIEHTCDITEEKCQAITATFAKVADLMSLKPGMKIPLEEAAKAASDVLLSPSGEKPSGVHDMLFDCIDTNSNGTISEKEFKVYFNVIAHNINDEEIKRCFDVIDSNSNGVINRDEFVAAAKEFFFGVEETELANAFYGQLLPN
ncbi:luciferin-binding protein-like [Dendronephthya gigantea]|uniref:luciferin-binding protein-like n=1 Tax=Dendronephthya gigantea TaxID=151771 RepID=UPI001069C6C4|nr:luciferin-binding protein-like [Dendronephthya gigantea]